MITSPFFPALVAAILALAIGLLLYRFYPSAITAIGGTRKLKLSLWVRFFVQAFMIAGAILYHEFAPDSWGNSKAQGITLKLFVGFAISVVIAGMIGHRLVRLIEKIRGIR